jgi:hypothetical protein
MGLAPRAKRHGDGAMMSLIKGLNVDSNLHHHYQLPINAGSLDHVVKERIIEVIFGLADVLTLCLMHGHATDQRAHQRPPRQGCGCIALSHPH